MIKKKLLIFLWLGACCLAQAKTQVVSLVATNYAPYYFADLTNQGFVDEIISQAFALADIESKVNYYPWKRSFELAKFGVTQGIFTISKSSEREEIFLFSEPIIDINIRLLTKKSNSALPSKYVNIDSLLPLVLANNKEYKLPESLENEKLNFISTIDDETAIRVLLSNRVDLVVIDEDVANYLIHKHFMEHKDALRFFGPPMAKIPQYLAVAKSLDNAQEIIDAFNQGLNSLKNSGTFARIIQDNLPPTISSIGID